MKQPFRFQQFSIRDSGSAMKIGTDGVLLGAWTPIREAKSILDIGTGCGIVALMLAQRTSEVGSRIDAIDLDQGAAEQALENFQDSPWPDRLPNRIEDVHLSLEQFTLQNQANRYDLIVCNPPFFAPMKQSGIQARHHARTTETLKRELLFQTTKNLLKPNGRFSLVLPYDQTESALELAFTSGFERWSRTNVRPLPDLGFKRVLLEFGLCSLEVEQRIHDELVVEDSRHQYSKDYERLTKEFHLRYAPE